MSRETGMVERLGGARACAALVALALVGATATAASAQNRSPATDAILACRSLTDPAAQLACFQKASEKLAAEKPAPIAKAPPAPTPSAQGTAAPAPTPAKRPFGTPKPRPVRTAKAPDEDSVKVKVLSFADRGDGRAVFHFDDGSTWVQTQSDESIAGSLTVGQTVTLKHGLFSGYIMEIPGRSFVRVQRTGGD